MTPLSPRPELKRFADAKARKKIVHAALTRAIEAAIKRHRPKVWEAEKMVLEARAAVALAELATHGITPMQTIIECVPLFQRRRGRYVVRISREGWARLVPVGKGGAILKGRMEQQPPWRWARARVTGETLREDT